MVDGGMHTNKVLSFAVHHALHSRLLDGTCVGSWPWPWGSRCDGSIQCRFSRLMTFLLTTRTRLAAAPWSILPLLFSRIRIGQHFEYWWTWERRNAGFHIHHEGRIMIAGARCTINSVGNTSSQHIESEQKANTVHQINTLASQMVVVSISMCNWVLNAQSGLHWTSTLARNSSTLCKCI